MADIVQILNKNLMTILDKAKINSSRFSQLCTENGLNVGKSTMSRLFNEKANIGITTLDDICSGVRLLPGFEWVEVSDLVSDQFADRKVVISYDQLSKFIGSLMADLDELRWVEVNNDLSHIIDVAALVAKGHGFEVQRKNEKQQLSDLRKS